MVRIFSFASPAALFSPPSLRSVPPPASPPSASTHLSRPYVGSQINGSCLDATRITASRINAFRINAPEPSMRGFPNQRKLPGRHSHHRLPHQRHPQQRHSHHRTCAVHTSAPTSAHSALMPLPPRPLQSPIKKLLSPLGHVKSCHARGYFFS